MSEAIQPGSDIAAPAAGVETPSGAGQAHVPADQSAGSATATTDVQTEGAGDTDADRQPRGVGKRISELLTERAYERQRAEAAERALRDALLQRGGQQDNVRQPPPVVLPPELQQYVGAPPDPSKFPGGEFDPAYVEERAFHRLKQENAKGMLAQRQAQVQQHQQREQMELGRRVNAMIEAGIKANPDFEAIALSPEVAMPPHVVRELVDCDAAHEVALYLGKNPAEARRIAGLSPSKVARELGRIEDRITAAKASSTPPTAAPSPPRTVRGAATAGKPSLDTMSVADIQKLLNGG